MNAGHFCCMLYELICGVVPAASSSCTRTRLFNPRTAQLNQPLRRSQFLGTRTRPLVSRTAVGAQPLHNLHMSAPADHDACTRVSWAALLAHPLQHLRCPPDAASVRPTDSRSLEPTATPPNGHPLRRLRKHDRSKGNLRAEPTAAPPGGPYPLQLYTQRCSTGSPAVAPTAESPGGNPSPHLCTSAHPTGSRSRAHCSSLR